MPRLGALGAFWILAPVSASEASPVQRDVSMAAPSCTADCNRQASDCLDACEEKYKTDDKGRVTCKFECANARQRCEEGCS
jgi:hypothetical protein